MVRLATHNDFKSVTYNDVKPATIFFKTPMAIRKRILIGHLKDESKTFTGKSRQLSQLLFEIPRLFSS